MENLSRKKEKLLDVKTSFSVDIPKYSFPKEESEIPKVLETMKNKPLSEGEMKMLNISPSTEMLRIVGETKKDYEKLILDINAMAMKEKMKYKRERPYEVSDKIENPKTTTDDTPSFPSGHSMLGYALEKVLSNKYPNKKKELKQMADKISLSRIQLGVHYPSDIKVGKEIGYLIGEAYVARNS